MPKGQFCLNLSFPDNLPLHRVLVMPAPVASLPLLLHISVVTSTVNLHQRWNKHQGCQNWVKTDNNILVSFGQVRGDSKNNTTTLYQPTPPILSHISCVFYVSCMSLMFHHKCHECLSVFKRACP